MSSEIRFAISAWPEDPQLVVVVPVIDETPLTDLIHDFERATGMETRDESYGGLIPAFFDFGSAPTYYKAEPGAFLGPSHKVPLLGCTCGEWGCWPLLAKIVVGDDEVIWTDFEQPHRRDRDYSGFGPFRFRRETYEAAIEAVAGPWAAARAQT